MRIRVRRETIHRYGEPPAKAAIQRLALTPRDYGGQHVIDWRIEVDRDCRLRAGEDAFGNLIHSLGVDGPLDTLTTLVEGEVETFDTAGVARGALERFPPELFVRETALTRTDAAQRDFARAATAREKNTLFRLHALVGALHEALAVDADAAPSSAPAAEAFARRRGGAADAAHVFIACARGLDIPSRYVSGYALRRTAVGEDARAAVHSWAESHVEGLGWVGFDACVGASPDDSYIRVAVALDHLGAAPIRGARMGGGEEKMELRVSVARSQSRSQSQA